MAQAKKKSANRVAIAAAARAAKKQPGKKQTGPRIPALAKRLLPDEKRFVEILMGGKDVPEAELAMGIKAGHGYRILKRPRVKAYLEKMGERIEEKAIEKVADKIVDMLEIADGRLMEILHSPRDSFFGYKDILPAIKLAYARKNAIPTNRQPTAGDQVAAAAAAAQVNVHVHQNTTQGGEGMYEPAWVRKQYGINDPAADAIDAQYAAQSAPQSVVINSTEVVTEAVDAGDEGAAHST